MTLDEDDRRILALLRRTGRLSPNRIRELLGISSTRAHRRLRRLEDSRVIAHYSLVIAPDALGLEYEVVAFATLTTSEDHALKAFEHAAGAIPEIVQAGRLGDGRKYIMHILTTCPDAFGGFLDSARQQLPHLDSLTWSPITRRLRPEPELPI